MTLFKNKYRIDSARLKLWDYGSNAAYFVTVCIEDMRELFGQVVNDEMELSKLGDVADSCWKAIPEHFPFVLLGAHVVMPNHVHGIIIIDKPGTEDERSTSGNKFAPQSRNLGSILRGYKIGVTKFASNNSIDFKWQSRFHDHVIRNEEEYIRIHNYIVSNPQNWKKDKFYNYGNQSK